MKIKTQHLSMENIYLDIIVYNLEQYKFLNARWPDSAKGYRNIAIDLINNFCKTAAFYGDINKCDKMYQVISNVRKERLQGAINLASQQRVTT